MADKPTLSSKTVRLAREWFQRRLRITDWHIEVEVQDDRPDWVTGQHMACVKSNRQYKTATVWISVGKAAAEELDPLSSLFHELMHIVLNDAGVEPCGPACDAMEPALNGLGDLLAAAYRAGVK